MKKQKQPTSVEIDDDIEIKAVANYTLDDPCAPINAKPGFKYFAALKDGGFERPDTVKTLLTKGYERCQDEYCLSQECELLRIPLDVFKTREKQRMETQANMIKGSMRPQGINDSDLIVMEGHGQRQRISNNG